MHSLITRIPVVEDEQSIVALVIGSPDVALGDEVSLTSIYDRSRFENYYVAGIDSGKLETIPVEVLRLFKHEDVGQLLTALERAYKTGLPANVVITIYTLTGEPISEFTGAEEVVS